ncbi:zinc finger protein 443-like [Saccostrea cucullata]|uniref:zinc finger protein 443-like n=1 Tax=Saccostrea cuccullata TaxID=36930 RepID=UPI002ECFF21A
MVDLSAGEDFTIVKTEPEDSFYPEHYTELRNPESSQQNKGQITPVDWSISNFSTDENPPLEEMSPRQINRADERRRRDSDMISEGGHSGEISPNDPRSEKMHPLVSNESLYSPPPPAGFGQGDMALHLSMFADQVAMQMKDMGTQFIKCPICHKDFSTRYGQKLHMERFHPDPKKSKSKEFPKCKICGKQMASKYALKIHEIKHTGQRAFKCELCGSSFGYKSVLKKHMEVCNLK